MDINIKRVITINKLRSLGINDDTLISKCLNGNYKSINTIYNKHIKGKLIKHTDLIHEILKDKSFRVENFFCEKCHVYHYLGSKVYYKHFDNTILKGSFTYKTKIIQYTLDNILVKNYRNNKRVKGFQELIDHVLGLCLKDTLTEINKDLRLWIIKTYKTTNAKYYNKASMLLSKKIEANMHTVKEIFDILKSIEYYHNLKGSELFRFKKAFDREGYIIDLSNYLIDLINTNDDTKEIMHVLDFRNFKINNTLKKNQIDYMINRYKESQYNMRFGINYSDNTDSKDQYFMGALPFSDSGKFESSQDDFEHLEYMIIHCHKSEYKQKINYVNRNPNFNLIDSGFNEKGKKTRLKQKRMHWFIIYTVNEILHFDNNFSVKDFCNKVYQKVNNDIIEKSKYIDYSNIMHRVDFSLNYDNKNRKHYVFNNYVKNMGLKHYFTKDALFYPIKRRRKNNIYSINGILRNPPSDYKIDFNIDGMYMIKKIKVRNMGNLERVYTKRGHVSMGLKQIIDNFDYNAKMGKPLIRNKKALELFDAHSKTLKPQAWDSLYLSNFDLKTLMNEIINDKRYKTILNWLFDDKELSLLSNLKILWNNKGKYSYRLLARYYGFTNTIKLQNTLKLMPKWVIKCTIWHEILHIKLRKHNQMFDYLEHQYLDYKKGFQWEIHVAQQIKDKGYKKVLSEINAHKSNKYKTYYNANLNKSLTYTHTTKEKDLIYLILKNLLNHRHLKISLMRYYNDVVYTIQTKINLRLKNIRKLNAKLDFLTEKYDKLPNKRLKTAKDLKKFIKDVKDVITNHKSKIKPLESKKSMLGSYYHKIFCCNKVLKPNKVIFDLLINDISKYYHKNLKRIVNTQRSALEIINYGLNHIFFTKYVDICINFEDSIHLDKIDKDNTEKDLIDGFDRILDYFEETKCIEKVVNTQNIKLPLNIFLRFNLKCGKWLYNPLEYNELIGNYLNLTENYRTNEISILDA